MVYGCTAMIEPASNNDRVPHRNQDFFNVSFNLVGADVEPVPSSIISEAVKGGLVASGEGTAAAKPNVEG
jgi:hypothetical protein